MSSSERSQHDLDCGQSDASQLAHVGDDQHGQPENADEASGHRRKNGLPHSGSQVRTFRFYHKFNVLILKVVRESEITLITPTN